jgi:hypothetical protein
MKKLVTISIMLTIFYFGCSNPVENQMDPVDQNNYSLSKANDNSTNSIYPLELYAEKAINGTTGGFVELNGQFINAYGDVVTVDAKLTIPSNSFFGVKVISIRTDRFKPALTFEPASYFYTKLKLDCKFTGVNVERFGLADGKTDFVYMVDNYNYEIIKSDGLDVDVEKNKAEVRGAKLEHFSRYGFIRKFDKQMKMEN